MDGSDNTAMSSSSPFGGRPGRANRSNPGPFIGTGGDMVLTLFGAEGHSFVFCGGNCSARFVNLAGRMAVLLGADQHGSDGSYCTSCAWCALTVYIPAGPCLEHGDDPCPAIGSTDLTQPVIDAFRLLTKANGGPMVISDDVAALVAAQVDLDAWPTA